MIQDAPKNPEKFTPQEQKNIGKLTPDEAKAMVQKFKKEHEGLLPEYFSLPGEENEEKEREYPEELLIYYEMKEQLKPIEEKLKDDTLRKNMIKGISENIEKGQQEKNTFSAWFVFLGYVSLLSYPEFNEIKSQFPEKIKEIEEGLKNKTIRKNVIEQISQYVQDGQKEKDAYSAAWWAFISYVSLLSYPEFNAIKSQFPEEIKKIEEGLKNETIRRNVIEQISKSIQEHQKEKNTYFAWVVFLNNYTSLLSYLNYLYKVGQKKLAEIESQKAMHPELRKNLPPIPEEKMF
jgi:REP element-mobilizing transposase RayT